MEIIPLGIEIRWKTGRSRNQQLEYKRRVESCFKSTVADIAPNSVVTKFRSGRKQWRIYRPDTYCLSGNLRKRAAGFMKARWRTELLRAYLPTLPGCARLAHSPAHNRAGYACPIPALPHVDGPVGLDDRDGQAVSGFQRPPQARPLPPAFAGLRIRQVSLAVNFSPGNPWTQRLAPGIRQPYLLRLSFTFRSPGLLPRSIGPRLHLPPAPTSGRPVCVRTRTGRPYKRVPPGPPACTENTKPDCSVNAEASPR